MYAHIIRTGYLVRRIAIALLIGTRLAAQHNECCEHKLTGISLGVYSIGAKGIAVTGDDIDGTFKTNFGGGAGVLVGLGITSGFGLFASIDVAKQEYGNTDYSGTFGLGHLELGARLNLSPGRSSTVPYLSASVGSRGVGARVEDTRAEERVDLRLSGLTYGVGGGLQRFFSPHMALDAGVSLGFGKFDHYEADGEKSALDVNASRSLRFRLGVTWHP